MLMEAQFNRGFVEFFEGETEDHCLEQANNYADENNLVLKAVDFGTEIKED